MGLTATSRMILHTMGLVRLAIRVSADPHMEATMFRVIALAAAFAATATVAGAQAAKPQSKSAVKTTTGVKAGTTHKRAAKKTESQAALQAEAKVSMETARATALKEVPNGTVKTSEIERENGKLIYSFAISVPGKSGVEEINVNAIDGSVVSKEHESAKTERKEAAQEAKEKKAKK
jgi:uncharacterized membrane protein YkoI